MNLAEEGRTAQPVFLSASQTFEHNTTLVELLREYNDDFVWNYAAHDYQIRNQADQAGCEEFQTKARGVNRIENSEVIGG